MTNKEDQRRRWREIAEQLGIEPGPEPDWEPEPEAAVAEPELEPEPEPIPEPVMEMEEEEDRPFELPPDDDLEPFPDEIAASTSIEESMEEGAVISFRDNSVDDEDEPPLDREPTAGEGDGAPADDRGPRRERGGRRRGRRRRGGRSGGRDKAAAADAVLAEPAAEPVLPPAAEAPNERRPPSRRRGERRDEGREPRGRPRRGRNPEPIEEERPQEAFEESMDPVDSFDDSADLESPDIAAQDDGEEYADLYSNWTVPSWTELIASLYRPER